MRQIVTNLWFDGRVEEALELYTSLIPDSRVTGILRYGEGGMGEPGDIMTADFELAGQHFTIINGGPMYKLSPAVSLLVQCETQAEIDELWRRLTEDGGEPGRCGWLVDRFGLSWQITPTALGRWLGSGDAAAAERVTAAFLKMDKLDIAELERAFRDE